MTGIFLYREKPLHLLRSCFRKMKKEFKYFLENTRQKSENYTVFGLFSCSQKCKNKKIVFSVFDLPREIRLANDYFKAGFT